LTPEVFEELFWDFELALLENNVALEVIEKVKDDLHQQLTQENVSRKGVDQVILETLKRSLEEVLTVDTFDLFEKIKTKKPYVITLIGVNGSGKTTTLAKIIHLLQKKGLSVVVAASDTFRAAAIQQLEEHTNKLGVKLIKHDYNADPSAVAFDAISHAKAKDLDVVLIDTAGRLQSNSNLMDELKKLIRVNKPDMNIFIGESVTGNDCVEQAMAFNDAVGIDGIVLSKADIDEKGGAALSVSYVTKKPILFLGTGQTYDDLKPFSREEVLENLGL
ncbi:MAG: signal recognition particle-docking protein FtsY, partial [Nanoarchaeota archaeon]|nr:signal recognition particle-docking protein FtsY [Nanoarchaeota archaeon]